MAGKHDAELRCKGNEQHRGLPPPPTSLASTGRRGGAGKRSGCKAKAMLNKRLGCGQSNFFRRDARHSHESAGAGTQSEGAGVRPFLPTQTQLKVVQPRREGSCFFASFEAFWPREQERNSYVAIMLVKIIALRGLGAEKDISQLRWACTSAQQPSRGWAMLLQHLPHLLHDDFHLGFADGYFWKMSSIPLSLQIFCYKRRGIPRPFTGKLPSIESCYLATAIKHCPRI